MRGFVLAVSLFLAQGCDDRSSSKPAPASQRTVLPAPPDVAAPPTDARRVGRGVFIKTLQPGTGMEHPPPTGRVRAHYTGWGTDGQMFETSQGRQAATFPLTRVIPGWVDGLGAMVVGEKARLWVPQELAYMGRPGRPAGMLVFDVELLDILPAEPGAITSSSTIPPPAMGSVRPRTLNGKPLPSPHRFPAGVQIPRMQIPPESLGSQSTGSAATP